MTTPTTPSRHLVGLKINLSVSTFTQRDAHDILALELEAIAREIQEGDTFAASGTMRFADYGSWEITHPFELDSLNKV